MTAARQAITLAISVGICLGACGARFHPDSLFNWHMDATLRKPQWTRPTGFLGPYGQLFILSMAVAAWLVWRQGGFSHARAGAHPFSLSNLR